MCPPEYFDVEYAINPYMNLDVPVDKELAMRQWQTLKRVYEQLEARVFEMPAQPGLPDMTFAANCGHLEGDVFLQANFRYDVRKPEAGHAADFFQKQNRTVVTLPGDVIFEGQGDTIPYGKDALFMGYGKRTTKNAMKKLAGMSRKKVYPLALSNDKFYHLDTCFGPLNEDSVVVSRAAFGSEEIDLIESTFSDVIYTNEQDDLVLAPNLVVIGKTVVMGDGFSHELGKAIEQRGLKVEGVDLSEFLKSGGGAKCLTLEEC